MTTSLDQSPQVTVIPEQVHHPTVAATATRGTPRRFTAAIVVAVVALVAALTALALTAGRVTTPTTTTATVPVAAFPFDAFGPGSTAYTGQVPAVVSATTADARRLAALTVGYGLASSVYSEQVPVVTDLPSLQGSPYSELPPAATAHTHRSPHTAVE